MLRACIRVRGNPTNACANAGDRYDASASSRDHGLGSVFDAKEDPGDIHAQHALEVSLFVVDDSVLVFIIMPALLNIMSSFP